MPDSRRPRRHVPLGKFFLETGRISAQQLDQALQYKDEHNCRLGQALVGCGLVTEEDLVKALRAQGRFQCINLTSDIVDPKVARRLDQKESERFRCLAINQIADHTTVVMEDPSDVYAIDELAMILKTRILPVFAEPSKIHEVTGTVYRRDALRLAEESSMSVAKLAEKAHREEVDAGAGLGKGDSGAGIVFDEGLDKTEESSGEDLDKPVINMVRSILEEAFLQGASDVHIEPRRKDVRIRFRIDGTLYERASVPKSWARPMVARIKVIANLDIAQRRLPQDGRVQFSYKGTRVDPRVATTPTLQGEGVVLRILDGGRELHHLEDLQLSEGQMESLERAITCRHGFVLTTGPTGSGKTTSLYAILQRFVGESTKIVTLEDPVENEVEGITQINANPKVGLTFAKGLRSILRQDPDVVLVGEIRDHETAQIAVQASMTGHIVLSTLHTVGAAETVTRLVDMGIERYLLADTLRVIIAQRLLRRICIGCRTTYVPDESMARHLGLAAADTRFFIGSGCQKCHGTGYRGRVGIYEVMEMTPEMIRLIFQGASTEEIERCAIAHGMTTLREDGVLKARKGLTTLQEVMAATSH